MEPVNVVSVTQGGSTLTNTDYKEQLSLLSSEKRKMYLAKADGIIESDLSSIQAYGSDLTKKIASNGESLLKEVRTEATDEVGQMIVNLLGQLDLIDLNELAEPGAFKRFVRNIPGVRKFVRTKNQILAKYDSIADNINNIANKIVVSKTIAKRDNSALQVAFNNTYEYLQELRDLILAAKVKYEDLQKKYQDMKEHPLEYEAISIQDMDYFLSSLNRKIVNLEVCEQAFVENLFQIRAIQQNNSSICENVDEIITNTLPIWKSQLALTVALGNQKKSIEVQQTVSKTTNALMRKNAEILKINSINVAKATEDTIISSDTIEYTTKALIETVQEVKRIHAEGIKEREALEEKLAAHGKEFFAKILSNE